MRVNLPQIRLQMSFLCLVVICHIHINAQGTPVSKYLRQAGDYADIYNGRLETAYSTIRYKNLPYYRNANYTDATVVYKNNYYPDQKARLDLFKEQLILLAPDKRYGIILGSPNVKKVSMYDKTFIWLDPPKESELKTGYYMQIFEGEKIHLFCKEKYSPQETVSRNTVIINFDHEIRYYLLYNNRYSSVKNKNSFLKLFPKYKKQINKFVKDNQLNFKQNPDKSFTSLAIFCEEILNSMNNL